MHIAFLTPEYPHERVQHAAGIGTSIKNLAMALVKESVRVSVFVYSQKDDVVFIEEGIKIHLISHKKFHFFGWYFYRKLLQRYLNNAIVSDKIDLVEAPDWTGITAFMQLKAPLVIRFHGSDAYFCRLEGRKQKWKNLLFERAGTKKAKAFIAPTDFAGVLTREIFNIKREITTIHHGLYLANFKNDYPGNYTNGMLLYIGTIIRKKGVFELPEILGKVLEKSPEARLVFIGADSFDIQTQSNSTWEVLMNHSDEKIKGKMIYLGRVHYSDVQHYIKKANICIFPTFAETLGMVTLEAMAMRKSVVNSNIGWAKELIVDGESGCLVHPKDHENFSSKIITLLENKEMTLEIGEKARKRVEEVFDMEKIVHQNIDFYKRQL